MAITFAGQAKRQQYFLFVAIGICVLIAFILWRGFFVSPREEALSDVFLAKPPQLDIDFSIFDSQGFRDFGKGRDAVIPPQEVGRKNPFIPFSE